MFKHFTTLATLLLLTLPVHADLIKKSKSGICHDSTSPFYERTKNYTRFESLADCLKSGGRLPKGQSVKPTNKPVSSNLPKYDRDKFGHGWSDTDRDCMNTRHELLLSQSTSTVNQGSNKCTIKRGRWFDPYTGKTFYEAKDVDIDHLVPLAWAWSHGAWQWSDSKREKFANDEINLFVVDKSTNRQKGAQSPLEWMPPAKNFHCQYITRYQRVVMSYDLILSKSEQKDFETLRQRVCR